MATRPCASEWTPHPYVLPRAEARRHACPLEKNWSRADEIRAELDDLGVQVTDTPSGPVWQLR